MQRSADLFFPFESQSRDSVAVYRTSFNVESYPEDPKLCGLWPLESKSHCDPK